MGTVPVLKPSKIVSILERLGFFEVRQKGSHKQFRHLDGRGTTVPFHAGKGYLACFAKKNCQGYQPDC